jgi:hypothetical protein
VEAACLLLPVELTSIQANYTKSGVELDWQTASEQNNAYFQVEHSENGHAFRTIGEIPGNGTTTTASQYHFLHHAPSPGINYYRLKQVDYDGHSEYSRIISAVARQEAELEVFPNPTDGPLFVSNHGQDATAIVIDLTGSKVLEQPIPENGMLYLRDLPNGIYFIEISSENRKTVKRILKD